jgi:hypothetical protein
MTRCPARFSLRPIFRAFAESWTAISHRTPPDRHRTASSFAPGDRIARFHANFSYQAGSWTKLRRVIAKVEWHPGELATTRASRKRSIGTRSSAIDRGNASRCQ